MMSAKAAHRRTAPRTAAGDPAAGDSAAVVAAPPAERHRWMLAVCLLWIAAIHSSGLFGAFVLDDVTLTDNPALLDVGSFEWFRLTKRPVTTATFAINFSLFGAEPFACHVINLLIHLAAACCLFKLVQNSLALVRTNLSGRETNYIALAATLIWGVHPLCTAAVTYIVQRAESLASLGILLCLWAWSKAFQAPVKGDRVGEKPTEPSPADRWGWAL
ncbi:MAG: hypothetical protein MI861_03530, partial [Pirellulales bacterium]|nr:hypothetical protein [Pirellulales bacterium]